MPRTLPALLAIVTLVVAGCATDEPALEGTPPPAGESDTFSATLDALNDSGVSGVAEITMSDGELTVSVDAAGLEATMDHPQHIHGPEAGAASCPGADADADDDGFVAVEEGAPDYGPVIVPLTPFPSADEDGNVTFNGSFDAPDGLSPLTDRVVVLHGMTADLGDGESYQASLPVACGTIEAA